MKLSFSSRGAGMVVVWQPGETTVKQQTTVSAMFAASKPGIFNARSAIFQPVFVANKPGYF